MKIPMTHAILATVSYRGIFDYPLTHEEVYDWLIQKSGRKKFNASLKSLIYQKKLYSVLFYGERWIVSSLRTHAMVVRKHRAMVSRVKWMRARWVSRWLSWMPTISFIGVTGGLSVDNVHEQDDIDFFLIIEPGALWISRFCVVIATEFLGVRRRPGASKVKDTICLNFFLARDHLALGLPERDLFSAYEILQCKPLYDKGGVYREFLDHNAWVKAYLPNAWKRATCQPLTTNYQLKNATSLFGSFLKLLELLAKVVQLWYMKHHRTTEIISDSILRFHPRDMRGIVKQELAKQLKRYNIPLDTIFYTR